MATVLIAGGATGIGRATARRLLGSGYDVHIADIDLDGATDAARGEGPAGARRRTAIWPPPRGRPRRWRTRCA
ncbi:hypothetical protein ACFQYP_14040 [Nonomuraea antimicrobica]